MNQLTENEIKELIEFKNLIIKLINDIPNNMELGEKIRRKIIKEEK